MPVLLSRIAQRAYASSPVPRSKGTCNRRVDRVLHEVDDDRSISMRCNARRRIVGASRRCRRRPRRDRWPRQRSLGCVAGPARAGGSRALFGLLVACGNSGNGVVPDTGVGRGGVVGSNGGGGTARSTGTASLTITGDQTNPITSAFLSTLSSSRNGFKSVGWAINFTSSPPGRRATKRRSSRRSTSTRTRLGLPNRPCRLRSRCRATCRACRRR